MKRIFHHEKDPSFKVLIVGCTHGDELIGTWILNELSAIKLLRGSITGILANTRAMERGVRYLESDLNRSFPGNLNGTYEERLATKLLPIIKDADLVIDIHSTRSDLRSAMITTKLSPSTRKLAVAAHAPRLLVMEITKNNALISHAKLGIAFEYGNDSRKSTRVATLRGIKKILQHHKMISGKSYAGQRHKTEVLRVRQAVKKPTGYALAGTVKNFKYIKEGEIFAVNGESSIRAKKGFYPILFGNNTYPDIFGFMGEKIKR